jgi:ADP-L-glycero-D-manno-heptose 6-epimerase
LNDTHRGHRRGRLHWQQPVHGLNARGIDDIIAVDDLTQGDKFATWPTCRLPTTWTPTCSTTVFRGAFGKVEAVFHEGACSDTMETDGKYMMDNNYTLSCRLVPCLPAAGTRLLYASSAATYGGSGHVPRNARVREAAQCLWLQQAAV